MQIIDDLTQAETLSVSVSDQTNELNELLNSTKCVVVCSPALWGKSTIIDNLVMSWEKGIQSVINPHILQFSNGLFLSDIISVWRTFLLNSLHDCLDAIKLDIEKKFPQLFEDTFSTKSSDDSINRHKLSTLVKATVRFYKKTDIQRPLLISGLHALIAIKQDWPLIETAFVDLLSSKNCPTILFETQHEYLVQKMFSTNHTLATLPFYFVYTPSSKKWLKALGKFLKKKNMKVADEVLLHLVDRLQNNPFYIKEAVNKLIVASKNKAKTTDVDEIIDQMLLDYNPAFSIYASTLSAIQTSYLCALAREETAIYAQENLDFYQLGTSANVAKMKRTFLEREILIIRNEKLQFIDPMLSLYFASKALPTIDC